MLIYTFDLNLFKKLKITRRGFMSNHDTDLRKLFVKDLITIGVYF